MSTAAETMSERIVLTKPSDMSTLGLLGPELSAGPALLAAEEGRELTGVSAGGSGVTLGSWLYSDSEETRAKGLTQCSD